MQVACAETDYDLGPWAAYVLGHHPYSLWNQHMNDWRMIRDEGEGEDEGETPSRERSHGIPQLLSEVDEALDILTRTARIDAVVLKNLVSDRAKFLAINQDINDTLEFDCDVISSINWNSEIEPGVGDLAGLMESSKQLVIEPQDLQLWLGCGAALGEYQFELYTHNIFYQRCHNSLRECIEQLRQRGDYPWLEEMSHRVEQLSPTAPWRETSSFDSNNAQRQDLAKLDADLRQALRKQARPALLLDLSPERLIFFGAQYYIGNLPAGTKSSDYAGRIPPSEAAFLWVLARRPAQEVARRTIRDEGNLEREQGALQFYVHKLREILTPALRAHCSRRRRPFSRDFKQCFIYGKRGQGGGPYVLHLPPERVNVSLIRPGLSEVVLPSEHARLVVEK